MDTLSRKKVYIDMDGVLCEYRTDSELTDLEEAGYFFGLAPRKQMVDAVKYLFDRGEYDVFILSSVLPQIEERARAEKNAWLDVYLPYIDREHRIFPLCGSSKAQAVSCSSRNDILCDDYSVNLADWHTAGGTAIKILNEINGKNGSFMNGPRLNITFREQLADAVKAV